jgi:hypothetical protein
VGFVWGGFGWVWGGGGWKRRATIVGVCAMSHEFTAYLFLDGSSIVP